jgi:spermidine synthase
MVQKVELLDSHQLEDGKWLCLVQRTAMVGGKPRIHHQLTVSGCVLMEAPNSTGSSRKLAELGLASVSRPAPSVLVGGLGFGLTLAAALDRLPPDASVLVSELYPAIVRWNREHLWMLEGKRLGDSRVRLEVEDVGARIERSESSFDAILLDVDNGPRAFHHEGNGRLYSPVGLARARRALTAGGTLAVWSAFDDPAFEQRLVDTGFVVTKHEVTTREESAVIWRAHKK